MEYEVVTEDGYLLTLYQLPDRDKIPILLVHRLEDSSDTWLLGGNDSLTIKLANAGCDVWLYNSRGNRYSRRQKHLDPDKDPEFWRFTFHEMGYYDLPAIIDNILNKTGINNLTAIGHSQCNTMFYVLGSKREEYNTKINIMIALGPIAFLQHNPDPIATFIRLSPVITQLVKSVGIHELLGDNSISSKLLHSLYALPIISFSVCVYGELFPIMGYDPAELEEEFYPTVAVHFPAGSSSMATLHFLQVGYRKSFAPYDYGSDVNRKISPLCLLWTKLQCQLFYLPAGMIPDVGILRRQLPNVVYYLENPRPLFNHLDYLWGKHVQEYLYPYIYKVLNNYNHTGY